MTIIMYSSTMDYGINGAEPLTPSGMLDSSEPAWLKVKPVEAGSGGLAVLVLMALALLTGRRLSRRQVDIEMGMMEGQLDESNENNESNLTGAEDGDGPAVLAMDDTEQSTVHSPMLQSQCQAQAEKDYSPPMTRSKSKV